MSQMEAFATKPPTTPYAENTPRHILAALGRFDLDPCAAQVPRPWPTADTHWTREDSSLRRPWHGRVWLHPPFHNKPLLRDFLARMADHGCGIAMVAARPATETFQGYILGRAKAVLFLAGHVHLCDGAGVRSDDKWGVPMCLASFSDADTQVLQDCRLLGCMVPL